MKCGKTWPCEILLGYFFDNDNQELADLNTRNLGPIQFTNILTYYAGSMFCESTNTKMKMRICEIILKSYIHCIFRAMFLIYFTIF